MSHLARVALLTLMPLPALAQVYGEIGSFAFALRAAIGFFGAIGCVVFMTGFIVYATRLGTERREEGIKIMSKGVSVLVVVILAAGILYWVEK